MPHYFFDTSVLIAYFKNEDEQTNRLVEEGLASPLTVAISAVTVAELWAHQGMNVPAIKNQRAEVIRFFTVMPLTQSIAENAGELRRQFGLAMPDAIIAATCQADLRRFFTKDPHFQRLVATGILEGEIYG